MDELIQAFLQKDPYLNLASSGVTGAAREGFITPVTGLGRYLTMDEPDASDAMDWARQRTSGITVPLGAEAERVREDALTSVAETIVPPMIDLYDSGAFGLKSLAEGPVGEAVASGVSAVPEDVWAGLEMAGPVQDALPAGLGAGLLGLMARSKVGKGADELTETLTRIARKHRVQKDYENDVRFIEKDTVDPDVPARVGTTGHYRGAPYNVNTPSHLGHMRRRLWTLLDEGAPGRDWYDNSARTAGDLTGGRENYKHLYAGSTAVTSRGASVPSNQGFGIKGYNQAISGNDINTGRFPEAQGEAIDTLRSGEIYEGGPKETPFYEGLTVDERAKGIRPTNDLWMARAFGFKRKNPDTGEMEEWGEGLGKAQHRFMDKEINLLTEKANEAKLGGFDDWTPEKVQAAIWVAVKAQREKTTVGRAARDFSDALNEHTMNIRYEANTPMPHLPDLDPETRMNTAQSIINDPQGRDVTALEMGLLTRPGDRGEGIYRGVVSPSASTRVLVGTEKGSSVVDPASKELVDALAAGRGLTLGQETVGTGNVRRLAAGETVAARNAASIRTDEDIRDTAAWLTETFGVDADGDSIAFPLHTPDGYDIMYFGDDPTDFAKKVKRRYGKDTAFGRSSGGLVGNMEFSGFKPSKQMEVIDSLDIGPAYERLDRALRSEAAALGEADDAFEKAGFGTQDEILKKTRSILAAEGLDGIRKAVEAGILPAIVLTVLAGTAQQENNIQRTE